MNKLKLLVLFSLSFSFAAEAQQVPAMQAPAPQAPAPKAEEKLPSYQWGTHLVPQPDKPKEFQFTVADTLNFSINSIGDGLFDTVVVSRGNFSKMEVLVDVMDARKRVIYSDWVEQGDIINLDHLVAKLPESKEVTLKVREINYELQPDVAAILTLKQKSMTAHADYPIDIEIKADQRQMTSWERDFLCDERYILEDMIDQAEGLMNLYEEWSDHNKDYRQYCPTSPLARSTKTAQVRSLIKQLQHKLEDTKKQVEKDLDESRPSAR